MHCLTPADFVDACHPMPLDSAEVHLWFLGRTAQEVSNRDGGWLRGLLAGYLGCPGKEVRLLRGEHGKPYLDVAHDLEFNLSHSGGGLLAGIARRQPLGVDIEATSRQRPALELARRFFAPDEAAALVRLDEARRQAAFLRLWRCKEAVVKALGRGIGFGLSRLAFSLDDDGNPIDLNVIDASAGTAREWQIVRVEPTRQHFGAVAWRGPPRLLRAYFATGP